MKHDCVRIWFILLKRDLRAWSGEWIGISQRRQSYDVGNHAWCWQLHDVRNNTMMTTSDASNNAWGRQSPTMSAIMMIPAITYDASNHQWYQQQSTMPATINCASNHRRWQCTCDILITQATRVTAFWFEPSSSRRFLKNFHMAPTLNEFPFEIKILILKTLVKESDNDASIIALGLTSRIWRVTIIPTPIIIYRIYWKISSIVEPKHWTSLFGNVLSDLRSIYVLQFR